MSFAVAELIGLLDLETRGPDSFRGTSPQTGWQRIFGGLVVAQALVAATRTVEDRAPHALHGVFMRPGDPAVPIDFSVTRLRDGRSFATRHCLALQHGIAIFTLTASFQAAEDGFDHQIAMPDVPPPEALPNEAEILARFGARLPPGVRRYLERERPIEVRPVSIGRFTAPPGAGPALPVQQVWMRATGAMPDDPALHRVVLAYLSDMTLLDTALLAHGRSLFEPGLQVASLDHALWFHRPARVDEWLLYAQDSPSASGARGLARGSIFARDGTLVASVAQEGLIRERRPFLTTMPKT